ncbi:flagellar hook-associated protein FlgL [Dyella sp. GSA-30]|uniref:flagellar hook-associated protein FlgL n=1 Tax=Dyella sp. GSA-30 TaxID=2994496 RepID=UPI002490FC31|nr:flagellar hook-associated protein FlgL [Dyella sp. GSA-30]BDU22860.1 flagellar hook-associated protein FlgL [Dyella sp. GSA-30]
MRISTSWQFQQSLSTMLNQQSALANTQNQVTTGKRINVASDDPTGAAQALSLNHILASNAQYTSNINAANTRLTTEGGALDSVTSLLDRARTLALNGINGSLSPSDRQNMATELTQIRDQLVQLANTTDTNGAALFAGTSTTTAPFTKNSDGTVTYNGNDGQLNTAVGSSLQVPIGDAGSTVFMNLPAGNGSFVAGAGGANTGTLIVGDNSVTDTSAWNAAKVSTGGAINITFAAGGAWTATDATGNAIVDSSGNPVGGTYTDGGSISFDGMSIALSGTPAAGDTIGVKTDQSQDVFSTLNNMITALGSGASDTQLANAMNRQIESIDQAESSVTNTQVLIGNRLNTLDQQSSAYSDLNVTYTSALSDVQDVDPYTAISNLSLQSSALQASQQVFAQMKSMTLFNYLK